MMDDEGIASLKLWRTVTRPYSREGEEEEETMSEVVVSNWGEKK